MVYVLKMTEMFEKKFYKLIPLSLQKQLWCRILSLSKNPYVGKPLGYPFIRELKLGKFRVYFTIFEDEVTVLMADISDKKNQQETIDLLIHNKEYLKKLVKNLKTIN